MTLRHNLVPPRQSEPQGMEGVSSIGGPPSGHWAWAATADRSDICHALLHVVADADLRWHRAEDIDACAGVKAPHNWCIVMLPLSQRVQPGVYTLMAVSRCRNALVRHLPPAEPLVYPLLVSDILTSCFDVLLSLRGCSARRSS